jgi:hypothetical protein
MISSKGNLLMRLNYFWNKGKQWLVRGLQAVNQRVKTWTQPSPDRDPFVADRYDCQPHLVVAFAIYLVFLRGVHIISCTPLS